MTKELLELPDDWSSSGTDFTKYSRTERIAYMIRWIEEFGYFNLSVGMMAKKFGKSRQQIHKDRQYIKDNYVDTGEIQDVKVEIFASFKKILKEARLRLSMGIKKDKNDPNGISIHEYYSIMDRIQIITFNLTKFLEAYGLKTQSPPMFQNNTNVAIQQNMVAEMDKAIGEAEELVRERLGKRKVENRIQ